MSVGCACAMKSEQGATLPRPTWQVVKMQEWRSARLTPPEPKPMPAMQGARELALVSRYFST